jgi:hypothetical protein
MVFDLIAIDVITDAPGPQGGPSLFQTQIQLRTNGKSPTIREAQRGRGAMPISLPSARTDAMLAENAAFQRLANSKSQEEWNTAFAAWREASAALIAAHALSAAGSRSLPMA